MSLAKGVIAVRRFVCEGTRPPDSAAALVELLARNAFEGRLDGARKTETSGWVTLDNLLDVEFTVEEAYHAPYLSFALRTDRKAIPPALLRALVARRARELLRDTGLERLPPGQRDEIREEIEAEYLPRILPNVSLVEVCWNLQRDVVMILNPTEIATSRVRKHFSATFSRALVPLDTARLALAGPDRAARAASLQVLGATEITDGRSDWRTE